MWWVYQRQKFRHRGKQVGDRLGAGLTAPSHKSPGAQAQAWSCRNRCNRSRQHVKCDLTWTLNAQTHSPTYCYFHQIQLKDHRRVEERDPLWRSTPHVQAQLAEQKAQWPRGGEYLDQALPDDKDCIWITGISPDQPQVPRKYQKWCAHTLQAGNRSEKKVRAT